MADRRTRFEKLERERARKAKAAAKRDRRAEREAAVAAGDGDAATTAEGEATTAELLEAIELIHRQLEAEQIGREEFEEKKAELLARLPIE
ncbi:MAG: hypothetical protein ACRD0N_11225 [Acidimicrobiales bacterium]